MTLGPYTEDKEEEEGEGENEEEADTDEIPKTDKRLMRMKPTEVDSQKVLMIGMIF